MRADSGYNDLGKASFGHHSSTGYAFPEGANKRLQSGRDLGRRHTPYVYYTQSFADTL